MYFVSFLGAVRTSDTTWKCDFCGFDKGVFGNHDTIAAHVKNNRTHVALRASKGAAAEEAGPSEAKPPPRQATLHSLFSSAVARGQAEYPSKPFISQLPKPELRSYVQQRLCHGFFADTVQYGGTEYDVRSLRLDVLPGGDWYADPLYVRTVTFSPSRVVAIDGTFRHKQCTLHDCTVCPGIPLLKDFRERVVAESQAVVKRGERIAVPGVRLDYLQHYELLETARYWSAEF